METLIELDATIPISLKVTCSVTNGNSINIIYNTGVSKMNLLIFYMMEQ